MVQRNQAAVVTDEGGWAIGEIIFLGNMGWDAVENRMMLSLFLLLFFEGGHR